jgi:cholesterol transport system auxiliary component
VTAAFERGLQQLAQDVVGWTLQSGQADQPTIAR